MMKTQNNDLISRAALLKHKGDCYDYDGHLLYAVPTGYIVNAPAVDAAPVAHGRWLPCGDDDIVCNQCGARYFQKRLEYAYYTGPGSDRMDGFLYCPHCGALLDGKEEDPD